MKRIYVRLDGSRAEALTQLAEVERRHPSDQAAILLAPVIDRLMQQCASKQEAATPCATVE